MKINNKLYYGIFLISLATLALEISLIRLFSISQFYHFAFMVVSIALFGIAASGTFLSIKKIRDDNILFKSSLLFSLSAVIGFFILNKISFDPYKATLNFFEVFKLSFYYILLGLPFFFFGIIIAYSFSKNQKNSGKIYFYNMFGSALGTLLALPLISFFNIKLIFIIGIIGLVSSLFFIKNIKFLNINKKLIIYSLILIFIILLFIPFKINISEYKELNLALNFPNSKLLFTKYNSFSRVDIVNSSFTRYAPGLSPSFKGKLPEQLGVLVDASNMDAITNDENLEFIEYLPNSIGYSLIKKPKILIINSGAGLDVLSALYYNSTVTALETNPIIIDLLKTEYNDFSGNIYNKADIHFEEGRAFLKRKEKYDVIILSLAGSVLSSSAGLTSLSENYLLTVEAFEDYLNSLNENGVLIITRFLLYPPRESLKLFSIALEVVDKDNIAMFRSWTTVTLLISKNKLDDNSIKKIKDFTSKNKFDIIYLPSKFTFTPNKYGKFKEPYYYNSIKSLLENKENCQKNYLFDIAPAYDNKPFYFNFFKFSKFSELYKIIGNKWQPFFDSGFLLFFILIQALILSLIFILLPLKFFKRVKIKKIPLIYFFCLGISYLFIEIVLIQKFILFLGHIIYSSTIIIFSLLLASSFGALLSNNLKTKKIKNIIILLFFTITLYSIFLPSILNKLIIFNLIIKIILSIIIIFPLAFIMGIPFPLGIRIINKKLIPWAWAFNGVASVLSPILAIIIALSFGYNIVLVLAAFVYLVSLIFIALR